MVGLKVKRTRRSDRVLSSVALGSSAFLVLLPLFAVVSKST